MSELDKALGLKDEALEAAKAALRADGFEDGDLDALPRERIVRLGETRKTRVAASEKAYASADELAHVQRTLEGIAQSQVRKQVLAALPESKRGDAKVVDRAMAAFLGLRQSGAYDDPDEAVRIAAMPFQDAPKIESAGAGLSGVGGAMPSAATQTYDGWQQQLIEAIDSGSPEKIERTRNARPAYTAGMKLYGIPKLR